MSSPANQPTKSSPLDPSQAEDPQRRTFADGEGREWQLELDFDTCDELRQQLKIDFGDVKGFTQTWAEILWDDQLALRLLWFLVRERAEGVEEKAWRKSMNGERLEAARDALLAAVFFFTPPTKRQMVANATTGVMDFYRAAIREAEVEIEGVVTDTIARFKKVRGTSQTKSPARSATSIAAGHSAARSRR
ncbi:MAG: hypothetical protein AB7I57_18315 [Pirellulales bacterium]